MSRNPRLEWALHLAAMGWPVFPLLPGTKVPAPPLHRRDRCPHTGPCRDGHQGWEQLATTRAAHIERRWTARPHDNIGLATGPAGVIGIDLDIAKAGKLPDDCKRVGASHGAQMLAHLAALDHATIPDTWTVATPSGGTHLYFSQPAGIELRSTRGSDPRGLAGLIDTRGWGGYLVAPGSTTPEGAYELVSDTEPAELPAGLLHRLTDHRSAAIPAPRTIASTHVSRYVAAALDGEAARVRTALPGQHNKAQMIAGLALGQLVGGGYLDRHHALSALLNAAAGHITGTCGCTEHGVTAVFEWGLSAGARNPRHHNPRHHNPEGTAA